MAKRGGINTNLLIWGGVAIVAILFGPMILKTVTSGVQNLTAGLSSLKPGTLAPAAGGGAKKAGGMKKRPKGMKSAKLVYDTDNNNVDVNRVTIS